MNNNYYYDNYDYVNYDTRDICPYCRRQFAEFVTQADVQSHINAGRTNHCFKGYWAGRDHTFILTGLRPDGTVTIIENGQPGTVHRFDIEGLSYLGVQCPAPPVVQPTQPTTPGGGGGGGGGMPGGGNCGWVQWMGKWVWACW